MENDFRFAFMKDGDYLIKCSDGSIPASRMVLNVSSKYMRKYLKQSKDVELVIDHSTDVVKPVIYYLHSLCFQMPKSFNLDFADRLLKAFDFFDLKLKDDVRDPIELSLCQKFVEERFDFNGILKWLQISIQHRLRFLLHMARNPQNPLFREIFGSDGHNFFEDREDENFTY